MPNSDPYSYALNTQTGFIYRYRGPDDRGEFWSHAVLLWRASGTPTPAAQCLDATDWVKISRNAVEHLIPEVKEVAA